MTGDRVVRWVLIGSVCGSEIFVLHKIVVILPNGSQTVSYVAGLALVAWLSYLMHRFLPPSDHRPPEKNTKRQKRVRGTVKAVDEANHEVTVEGPDKQDVTVKVARNGRVVRNAAGRRGALSSLKRGQKVVVLFGANRKVGQRVLVVDAGASNATRAGGQKRRPKSQNVSGDLRRSGRAPESSHTSGNGETANEFGANNGRGKKLARRKQGI